MERSRVRLATWAFSLFVFIIIVKVCVLVGRYHYLRRQCLGREGYSR